MFDMLIVAPANILADGHGCLNKKYNFAKESVESASNRRLLCWERDRSADAVSPEASCTMRTALAVLLTWSLLNALMLSVATVLPTLATGLLTAMP